MKLYYYKGACSLSVRIIMHELGLKCNFETIKELQTRDKITESGENLFSISSKNQIPILQMDDGRVLTECSAIMIYLAEFKNDKTLLGGEHGFGRYRVFEWLSFLCSEVHKNFVPIVSPIIPADAKPVFHKIFLSKLSYIEKELQGKDFLVGTSFTLADSYFFVILTWLEYIDVKLESYSNLKRYFENLSKRESIITSLTEEGLIE